jgi:hypothetical protein
MGCSRPLTTEARPCWSQGAHKIADIGEALEKKVKDLSDHRCAGGISKPPGGIWPAAVKHTTRTLSGPPSQSVSFFTVPPRAHPSTGSQSGSATPGLTQVPSTRSRGLLRFLRAPKHEGRNRNVSAAAVQHNAHALRTPKQSQRQFNTTRISPDPEAQEPDLSQTPKD